MLRSVPHKDNYYVLGSRTFKYVLGKFNDMSKYTLSKLCNLTFKIMRFDIQNGELLGLSKFKMDFIETWHTCTPNSYLLNAALLEPLAFSFKRVN